LWPRTVLQHAIVEDEVHLSPGGILVDFDIGPTFLSIAVLLEELRVPA